MKVTIEPYNPRWQGDFCRHKLTIESAIGHLLGSVDHIGSTSLGDIAAKPIIDVLVGITDQSLLDETIEPILNAGYTYIEKFTPGMPYRRFFVKLTPLSGKPLPSILATNDVLSFGVDYNTVVNIHAIEQGSYHWMRHIAFRDYLLAHPDVRIEYERLKLEIVKIDFSDPLDYNAHKEGFISKHQELAVRWFLTQKTRSK
ncbi:GrpB family protein [Methylomonas koyamae]|uniref:GrpB family protein n=1 Tax=Methylomonas koyamae TaxID=702114 RepID=UPI000AFA0757|nr:GrpB family protein [Methylomonas koyamae]BBL59838.1 hypothetical protein MKFW12EY_34510 [Methylomonas koyamae]